MQIDGTICDDRAHSIKPNVYLENLYFIYVRSWDKCIRI